MNADGSNPTRLTSYGDYDGMPAWSSTAPRSPSSATPPASPASGWMDATGANAQQRSTQTISEGPAWSPDGTKIAYDADGNGDTWQEVWLMDASGANQRQVYHPHKGQTDAWVRVVARRPLRGLLAHHPDPAGRQLVLDPGLPRRLGQRQSGHLHPLQQHRLRLAPGLALDRPPGAGLERAGLARPIPGRVTVRWSGADPVAPGRELRRPGAQRHRGAWTDLPTTPPRPRPASPASAGAATSSGAAPATSPGSRTLAGRLRRHDHGRGACPVICSAAAACHRRRPRPRPWAGSDQGGSGIQDYDVQVRSGSGA